MVALVLTIKSTEALDVDNVADVVVDDKAYSWVARIVSDIAVHVSVGVAASATEDDFVVTAFEPVYLSIPAGSDLAILGSAAGTAWVTEVKFSG
jgi:hypothetical protein